jgi:hypothetical protein
VKQKDRESGKFYVKNYVRKGEKQAFPTTQPPHEHLEVETIPIARKVEKTPKFKSSKHKRNKQASAEVVASKFVSFDTQIKEPLEEK